MTAAPRILPPEGLESLVEALAARGYRVLGPTERDGAIVLDDIASAAELPWGRTDAQEGGHYRLEDSGRDSVFHFNAGADSWKTYLHPPMRRLWHARRDGDAVEVTPEPPPTERMAFLGLRACDLAAIAVQDRVFLGGPHVDRDYAARREGCFLVAVTCAKAGGTCFCASMGTGPRAEAGFDLALTEIEEEGEHRLLAEAGSRAGAELLSGLPSRAATEADIAAAQAVTERTAASMGREMPAAEVPDLLRRNPEHPRWNDVASRCLTCANCTMVCPTCFCTSVEDRSDLTGAETERVQRWDSCFTTEFSYIHGGAVRASPRSRYRQWMTHKLSTWHDQFGGSGCTGCGRCITWCPVGIDITAEVAAIRDSEGED